MFFWGPSKFDCASFAMAYDTIVDNLYILSLPPQFNQQSTWVTNFPGTPIGHSNFLANGAIPPTLLPGTVTDPVAARAATSAFIPDQQVPYSESWSLTYQREFHKDFALEVRYLGSRGVHLPTQNRINVQDKVFAGMGGSLPTFLAAPDQASIDSLGTSLADIQARSNILPNFLAAFTATIQLLVNGNSSITPDSFAHQRFTSVSKFSGAILGHLIDDRLPRLSDVLSRGGLRIFRT